LILSLKGWVAGGDDAQPPPVLYKKYRFYAENFYLQQG